MPIPVSSLSPPVARVASKTSLFFAATTSPMFIAGGVRFFPVEAVAAVIEVKSNLTTQELRHALQNVISVKRLDRTRGGTNYMVAGGAGGLRDQRALDAENHEHQIFSLIVAARGTRVDGLISSFRS